MPSLIQTIKQVAMEAFTASRPTSILYGEVICVSPLRITVDQKKILEEPFLILTNNVKVREVTVYIDHATEVSESHYHNIYGNKTYRIYNDLQVGENVILIQAQGGQEYIVLDRM